MTSWSLFQNTFISRRSEVAIFADVIKITTFFIKQSLKTQKKFTGFQWKIDVASRIQEVCHVIQIFLGSFLGKV